jgi:NDP-sugar pyrophosphorylase family protein
MALMNGMLLAAGRGERMEPLSTAIAKPTVEVLGQPLLASAVAHLRRAGCERVVVNLHRHPESVAAAARACGGELAFSWEPELLGSAGGLAAARPLLGGGAVLVANADVWCQLNLAPLLTAQDDETLTMALLPNPDPARWSSVILDDGGRVRALLPPGSPHHGERFLFTGFQLVGGRVLALLPPPPADMPAVWETLRRREALRGVVVSGSWHEAGTPGSYLQLLLELLGHRCWLHPQATVAAGARILRSAIGAGCGVGEGASVCESIVMRGATVAAGCELQRCVVAGPVTVNGALSEMQILPQGHFPLR